MTSISLPIAGFMGLGGPEVLIILAIVLIFFGGRKLPELAKGLGKSIKEFKKASSEADDEIEAASTAQPKPAAKSVETTKAEPAKTHGTN